MGDQLSIFAVAGLSAGALSLIDPIPYVRDVRRGRTRPHRGTHLIWCVLGVTVLLSQLADGATWSLAMVGAQAVATTVTFGLSIRNGEGGVGRADVAMLLLAAAAVAGWRLSSQPVVATGFVVVADAIGVGLMLPKTWRNPWSETLSTFVLATAAGALGVVAVGALDPALMLYPVYFAGANGLTAAVIGVRRAALVAARAPRWVSVAATGATGSRTP